MIYFDITRVLNQKGILNHSIFLQQLGFKDYVIKRMMRINPTRIDINLLGALCNALNCTPNDLLSVTPALAASLPPNHALKTLVREKQTAPISLKLVKLPLEKLAQVQELVDKLTEEGK